MASSLTLFSARDSWLRSLAPAFAALAMVFGILTALGSSIPRRESSSFTRYCEGGCVCDGGSLDAALMARVCPSGWQRQYRRSVLRYRKAKRLEAKREIQKKLEQRMSLPNV